MITQSVQRDQAWGRFFARRGTARVLAEADHALHNDARLARWAATWFRHGFHRQPERIHATVPQPLMPARTATAQRLPPPEVAAMRAGSPLVPAFDDDAAWLDYMRRAFAGEFIPF